VRGPVVMNAYHARDEETARRRRGGWHHTNDLGRREDDGSITFVGPKTKLVKSGAENVYPAEVEACLMRHPAVREAAVIGVPDAEWGQNVKAVVALHPGNEVTADDLIEHCKAQIASYKKPKEVDFVDGLPRTEAGLVDRDAVDAAHGGGGYRGGTMSATTLDRLEKVAGVNAPDPTTWEEFWPYYVSQHLHPVTRLFHVWGPITAAVVGIYLIVQGRWWAVPAGFAIGYGFAWFSHFVIEKNKPASFGHPLWSFPRRHAPDRQLLHRPAGA
jgi:hypothetical protein